VEGRVKKLDQRIAVGNEIPEGTEILKIDPRNYEIALARANAAQDSAKASLEELATTETNNRATLKLEKDIEVLVQADLDRQIKLVKRGTVSQSTLDTARRTLIAQQKVVLAIENTLRLLPIQRSTLMATMATRKVEIEEAKRALDNTIIRAPFTGIVKEKNVSETQFVSVGTSLLTIEDISASEVVAEFHPRLVGGLFRTIAAPDFDELIRKGGEWEFC
jgi:multidrug resistance efflux pump